MVNVELAYSRKRLSGQLVWFGLWVGATAVGAWLVPDPSGHGTHTQLGLPPCPSVLLWNRPCPGCGITTSFSATIHGDFAAAWTAHPFGPFIYAIFTLTALAALYGYFRKLRFDFGTRPVNIALLGLLALYLVHGAIRFVESPPFSKAGVSVAQSRK